MQKLVYRWDPVSIIDLDGTRSPCTFMCLGEWWVAQASADEPVRRFATGACRFDLICYCIHPIQMTSKMAFDAHAGQTCRRTWRKERIHALRCCLLSRRKASKSNVRRQDGPRRRSGRKKKGLPCMHAFASLKPKAKSCLPLSLYAPTPIDQALDKGKLSGPCGTCLEMTSPTKLSQSQGRLA